MTSFRLPADDLEYSVLAKLWELAHASVRDVHELLGKPGGLAYTHYRSRIRCRTEWDGSS